MYGSALALDATVRPRHAASAMSNLVFESTTTMDQASFVAWVAARPAHDDHHYELLGGRIVMTPPAGWPHGNVESRLVTRMTNAAARPAGRLSSATRPELPPEQGLVFGSSQGFELPTGDTVEPDASFVSLARWRAAPAPEVGKFLAVVPDLVVEILSNSTASRDRGEKRAIYAAAGVHEYVLVDPRTRTLQVFTRGDDGRFDTGRLFAPDERWDSAVLLGLSACAADLQPQ